MKTFTLAVAVAIMVTCICLQESSATSTKVVDLEEPVSYDHTAAEYQETPGDSWMMPYSRQKRGLKCRFCCGCCFPRVCGLCCRF